METSRHWRLRDQRYALVGEECDNCGVKIFPPRDVCLECEAPAKELFTFTGTGEVYSYTTIYDAPAGFEQYTPYTVALVKLDEGPTPDRPTNRHRSRKRRDRPAGRNGHAQASQRWRRGHDRLRIQIQTCIRTGGRRLRQLKIELKQSIHQKRPDSKGSGRFSFIDGKADTRSLGRFAPQFQPPAFCLYVLRRLVAIDQIINFGHRKFKDQN